MNTEPSFNTSIVRDVMRSMRIGLGFDVHAFSEDRTLILGGVTIPHTKGLLGHSDADVVTHALMDAILSAMRAGDIGKLFPDTDPAYKGADSIGLLKHVVALMHTQGFELIDTDIVIAAQEPKISPYREQMRSCLAEALEVPVENVGLKATTTEWLGFVGRSEGIATWANVVLCKGLAEAGDTLV